MTLKDWKRDIAGDGENFRIFFDDKKSKVEHTIDIWKNKDGTYSLRILYDGKTVGRNEFKTRFSALTYAKEYMEKF